MTGAQARTAVGVVLLVAVIGVGFWALLGRGRDSAPEAEGDEREFAEPLVSLHESVIQHGGAGSGGWKLQVDEMNLAGGGRAVSAAGLREGLIYDAQGRPVLRISAAKAIYNTARKDFEVSGGVKVVSHQGAIITTERMLWLPEPQILRCPGPVTVRSEGVTITTDALDLHVPEDLVKSTSQVRLRTPDGRLTGRNLIYNLKTHDYTLESIQAVFTVDEAREELGRLR
jgi:lipopolysaccharide export system protein LptC